MPLSPSGVGTQTRYIIETLIKTGKYKFISLGGAIKHPNYNPIKTEEYGDDWLILPVKGYGSQDLVRSVIRNEKPDMLWFMTDPRFWGWLWEMENEIRPLMPMVYYHVWDNYPYPTFNATKYRSNDFIGAISKVTNDIVKTVAPDVESEYIPHAVDTDIFKKRADGDGGFNFEEFKADAVNSIPERSGEVPPKDRFLFFWNNRNARRKQSGTLIFWFKKFLDKVGHDKAILLMHTEPKDPNGQDLEAIIRELGLVNGEVLFSTQKMPPQNLSYIYNIADCTINIADAEGFGLGTLESLSCETPIIVNMTGGLQEQVTDGENWFGVGIEPASKSVIGSQPIPWIREDRLNEEDVVDAMMTLYKMSPEERSKLGRLGREHVVKNYNFEKYGKKWDEVFTRLHEQHGSWETRKNHSSWTLKEIE